MFHSKLKRGSKVLCPWTLQAKRGLPERLNAVHCHSLCQWQTLVVCLGPHIQQGSKESQVSSLRSHRSGNFLPHLQQGRGVRSE